MTRQATLQHSSNVIALSRRLAALVLALSFSAGHLAECSGWQATGEARMACCVEGVACPMHKSDSTDSTLGRVVTQADADSCCAASEGDHSTPSVSSFGLTVAVAIVPVTLPAIEAVISSRPASWRTVVPPPADSVPRHLLLSVFLV